MSDLKTVEDLMQVAEWTWRDYADSATHYENPYDIPEEFRKEIREEIREAIQEYAWSISMIEGWDAADFWNACDPRRGVVKNDPSYREEFSLANQHHAACLHWLRTEVELQLLRQYRFYDEANQLLEYTQHKTQ